MTKHKHAELIKAKADNMELVVFFKADEVKWRRTDSQNVFPTVNSPHVKYFLCHPKHADVCLHWLNGGEVVASKGLISTTNPSKVWSLGSIFMDDHATIIIKPRKEKRWIVVKNGMLQSNHLFECDNEAADVCGLGGQFIEIEVEV